MLELLDVAIGFATVMLAVSLIIMSLTQALSSVLALRGTKLRKGLWQLIEQTAPSIKAIAKDLSRDIVSHPLVSDAATVIPGRWRWAALIKKEELMPVLDAVLKGRGLKPEDVPAAERAALEEWFDAFMTRVSQWFVMNTRWITVTLAVVLSFALHLDSWLVLKQLAEDKETRAKVLTMSESLLDQTPESVGSVEARYSEALQELFASNVARFKEGTNANPLPKITKRSEASEWIETHVKLSSDTNALVTQYNEAVDKKLTEAIDKSIDRAKTLHGALTSAGISLPPKGHTREDWFAVNSPHFWGMLSSVLFLSLGAPFWFNLLKNMTSLKSAVAIKKPGGGDGEVPMEGVFSGAARPAPTLPALPAQPPANQPAPKRQSQVDEGGS